MGGDGNSVQLHASKYSSLRCDIRYVWGGLLENGSIVISRVTCHDITLQTPSEIADPLAPNTMKTLDIISDHVSNDGMGLHGVTSEPVGNMQAAMQQHMQVAMGRRCSVLCQWKLLVELPRSNLLIASGRLFSNRIIERLQVSERKESCSVLDCCLVIKRVLGASELGSTNLA